jgi:hypothetical protein
MYSYEDRQARTALRVFSILPANRKIRAIEFLLSSYKLAFDFGKEPEVERETLALLLLAASSIRTQSMFMDYLKMLSTGDTSGKEADSKLQMSHALDVTSFAWINEFARKFP